MIDDFEAVLFGRRFLRLVMALHRFGSPSGGQEALKVGVVLANSSHRTFGAD
jgi:hypothetical protein